MNQLPTVEFTASWEPLLEPEPVLGPTPGKAAPRYAAPDDTAGARDVPAVPWRLSSDGYNRILGVGPVSLEPSALDGALASFRSLRESVSATISTEPGTSDAVGVRVTGPPVGDAAAIEVHRVVTGSLAPLLGPAATGNVEVDEDDDGLVLRVLTRLLPEVVDTVVVTLAAAAGAAVDGNRSGEVRPDSLFASVRALRDHLLPLGRSALIEQAPRAEPAPTVEPAPTTTPDSDEFGPLRIVEFRPGARPVDEARESGAGCSEPCGFVTRGQDFERDALWILFGLDACSDESDDSPSVERGTVRLSAAFVPGLHSPLASPVPVPGLVGVPVTPRRVAPGPGAQPVALAAPLVRGGSGFVAEIDPVHDLLPSRGRSWAQMPPGLRAATPDGEDPFTFAHMYFQRLRVELALLDDAGTLRARRSTEVEVFDVDRIGSLYERLITRLVAVDARGQAVARGVRRIYEAYHPWYPVLAIGLAKARLYMRAVTDDISLQQRNLVDPSWLMRVGLHLEFLTCLGIIEAVRPQYPDLLTPVERQCWEHSPAFAETRARIDTAAWREVWAMRRIEFAHSPLTAAGPVDFRNLLTKQAAVLAFLEAHHADLRHAIALAGPAPGGGQHTWHRVFRDAERAVVDSSRNAFPELRHLRSSYRDMVLWHERGTLPFASSSPLPAWLSAAVGDRDGAYPTAARRYRASMNEVAAWAKDQGLMDYYGPECITKGSSLIEARLAGDDERYDALQAEDGFGPRPERTRRRLAVTHAELAGAVPSPHEDPDVHGNAEPLDSSADDPAAADTVVGMLRASEIFQPLTTAELYRLAHHAVQREHADNVAIIVEGRPTTGLHLLERGTVDVLVTQADGTELTVDRMETGDVFGEYALLTGRPTSATVRARGPVVVSVIPPNALAPVIANRPDVIVELSVLLADRRINRRARSDDYLHDDSDTVGTGVVGRLAGRMRAFLLA